MPLICISILLMFWIVYIYLYIFALDLESFSDIMTFFPSSCVYFNNFFMFTLSSAAGPSTSSSDDTLPKETDSPKCFKEKRKRPRSELTDFFREESEKQDQKFKLFMDQMDKCRKRSLGKFLDQRRTKY